MYAFYQNSFKLLNNFNLKIVTTRNETQWLNNWRVTVVGPSVADQILDTHM